MTVKNKTTAGAISPTIANLQQIENKVRWLASWMIHNANHIRPSEDGLKVGGHQASSASISTIMTALYFHILKPQDKVAVKPHASPNFHAIQYMLGRENLQQLKNFRSFGGAQSYPSITKDQTEVDFSTGSVGLGVAASLFSSITQDYVTDHNLAPEVNRQKGRMISILGDAELDEGNIFEALLEGWKKNLKNTWWVIDYNRQSLDGVINDNLYQRILDFFKSVGWEVVTLKYGKLQQKAFEGPAGKALKQWIDECPNQLYSALIFKGGAAFRERLRTDLDGDDGLEAFLNSYDDEQLLGLMNNLGGHDMAAVIEAFEAVQDDKPRCFVAYTIKGFGLPIAGHKDNHAGMMTPEQMAAFRTQNDIEPGQEWQIDAAMSLEGKTFEQFCAQVPYNQRPAPQTAGPVLNVDPISTPKGAEASTQLAFGKIMSDLAGRKDEVAKRLVTTSPDVASSTNLSAWINKRGVYHANAKDDVFKIENIPSTLKWLQQPQGQHIELGIAESNLFSLLTALGQSEKHFGTRLLPIGTLYDPFICRGLDALNYGCYQDARFMLVATPSGLTLAPEGGAHQSFNTPMIGMAQPNLLSFEPAYADELAVIMQWGLEHMQKPQGSSVYLRLSTRSIKQPERNVEQAWADDVCRGAYWVHKPQNNCPIVIAYMGAIAPEAQQAFDSIVEEMPDAGLLAITSADRLYKDWHNAKAQRQQGKGSTVSHIESMLSSMGRHAGLVTVTDGHPAALTWLGSVLGHRTESLGITKFGQSGNINQLYQHYRLDAEAIVDACASVCINTIEQL